MSDAPKTQALALVADDEFAERVKAVKAAGEILAVRGSAGPFASGGRQPANLHDLLSVAEYLLHGPTAAVAFSNAWAVDVIFESEKEEDE